MPDDSSRGQIGRQSDLDAATLPGRQRHFQVSTAPEPEMHSSASTGHQGAGHGISTPFSGAGKLIEGRGDLRLTIQNAFSSRAVRRKKRRDSIMAAISRHYARTPDVLGYLGIGGAIYAVLYLALGKVMLPTNGVGFALFLVWACAHVGGFIASQLGLPPLLGMLVLGIVLRNNPIDAAKISIALGADLVHALPDTWGAKIRIGGLAVILLRAGLKIDRAAFKKSGAVVARLALLPILTEAVVASLTMSWVFGMPFALAFTGGFIQAAISPTVMVTGMLELQRQGYGESKSIPSVEMAAASMDSITAIVGFAIAAGVGIPSQNRVYSVVSGPMQVLYGLICGAGAAFLCSWTQLWVNEHKRTAVVLFVGVSLMYLGLHFSYLGGGSVACLSLGILAGVFWSWGMPGRLLSKGPKAHYAKQVDHQLGILWLILVQPFLFGLIGAEIDFHRIPSSSIPRTLIVIGLGTVCARVPMAFLVLVRSGYTWREHLFMALSWCPKATIQGALGSYPLMLIQQNLAGSPQYPQYEAWGLAILSCTAFSIIVCAPIGLLIVGLAGPRLLPKGQGRREKRPPPSVSGSTSSSSSSSGSDSESGTEQAGARKGAHHRQPMHKPAARHPSSLADGAAVQHPPIFDGDHAHDRDG